jgi:hypothetical protein
MPEVSEVSEVPEMSVKRQKHGNQIDFETLRHGGVQVLT